MRKGELKMDAVINQISTQFELVALIAILAIGVLGWIGIGLGFMGMKLLDLD